ncbi:MAG: class I SAM-dependent methyltransferase [Simkaniaceae bacterium]|nr:class I SAM-dependent methyltransferase [Simkaniaceae bacterium]
MLDPNFISQVLLKEAPYSQTHGAISEKNYLGTAMLYYAHAYMLPAKFAVILGSGGGFVPRIIRQAQRDIEDQSFQQSARTLLIDANLPSSGAPEYHDNPNHFFRTSFPDIEIWQKRTDEIEGLERIDYLHIDADHSYAQSLRDFERFLPMMSDEFIITIHDTSIYYHDSIGDGAIPRTIAHLRREMERGGKYAHLEMINYNNRHRNPSLHFQDASKCSGVAVIKPKKRTLMETSIGQFAY